MPSLEYVYVSGVSGLGGKDSRPYEGCLCIELFRTLSCLSWNRPTWLGGYAMYSLETLPLFWPDIWYGDWDREDPVGG